jgi:hypothetical protein
MPAQNWVDLGYECKLFRGTPGTAPATLVDEVMNLRMPDARDKKETTRRKSGGMKVYRTGLRDVSVEFEIPWSRDAGGEVSADLNAFCNAYDANDAIALKIMDAANRFGIVGDFLVESRPTKQELGDIVTATITLIPTDMYGRVPAEV